MHTSICDGMSPPVSDPLATAQRIDPRGPVDTAARHGVIYHQTLSRLARLQRFMPESFILTAVEINLHAIQLAALHGHATVTSRLCSEESQHYSSGAVVL